MRLKLALIEYGIHVIVLQILILNIENNVPIHINDAGTPITCMSWVPCEHEQSETSLTETKDTNETIIKNNLNADVNEVWSFLTQLPSLSKAYSYNPSGAEDGYPFSSRGLTISSFLPKHCNSQRTSLAGKY